MAVRASLTGHKVYSTIHTRDPREVYFRLEDMKVEKYLIRDSLVGIVSQRLIRLLCDNCKTIIDEKNIDGNFLFAVYDWTNFAVERNYSSAVLKDEPKFLDKDKKVEIDGIERELYLEGDEIKWK